MKKRYAHSDLPGTSLIVFFTLFLLLTGGIHWIQGLQDVSDDVIFEGNVSLSTSPYVKRGNGTQGNPYIVSDLNMSVHDIQVKNTTSYLILRNITFSRASSWAIYLYNTQHVVIDNVSSVGRGSFLYSFQGSNIMLTRCNISGIRSAAHSLQFVSGIDIVIMDSFFSEDTVTGGAPIHFDNQGSGHDFFRNFCRGIGYIDEKIGSDGGIRNSTFMDSPVSISGGDTGAIIIDNSFFGSSGNDLTVTSSYRLNIAKNLFKGGRSGIFFQTVAWQWNTVRGSINNNTFESCGVGIDTANNWQTRVSRYEITYNYFGNCSSYAIIFNYGMTNYIWRNIFYHNAGTDNSSSGSQASQTNWGQPQYKNQWTIGKLGNFWANHRTPDGDNDGIVDINYTISAGGLDTRPSTNPYFDTGRPLIRILDPPSGDYPRSYMRVRWEASDELSGIDKVELSLDGEGYSDVTEKSHHSLFLEKGSHDIDVRAYDRAGLFNISSIHVLIHETEEVLEIENPSNGVFYSEKTQRLAWTVKPYFLPVNLSLVLDGKMTGMPTNARYSTRVLEEGHHDLIIHVEDDDGLTFEKEVSFTIDIIPPVVDILSPLPYSVLSNSYVVTNYTAWDNYGIEKIEVRFDDGIYQDRTGIREFSDLLSFGDHIMNLRAFDLAGLETNLTVPFRIGGDAGIRIISPVNGSVTRNTTLGFQWDYLGSFPWTRSLLRVGKGIFEDIGGAKSGDVILLGDGEYIITIRLEDSYGNYIENKTSVIKDTRPPIVDFLNPSGSSVLNHQELTIGWGGVDNTGLPMADYRLRIDDDPWEDLGTSTMKDVFLAPGEHSLYLKGFDQAGNMGEKGITFNIDTTPPVVRLIYPTDGSFLSDSSAEIRWEASDNLELTNLTLSIDNRIRIEVLGRSSYITNIGTDGNHTISLIGMDIAGNTVNVTVSVFIDLMPPSLEWIWEPRGFINRSIIHIGWSVFDEFGVVNLSLSIDDLLIYLDPDSSGYNATLSEGEHEISLTAVDGVGHSRELISTGKLIVDRTPPDLWIDPDRSKVSGNSATLFWTSTDPLSGLNITLIDLDGEGFSPVLSGNVYTFEDLLPGEHTVTLVVRDRAGNVREDTWKFDIVGKGSGEGGDDGGGGLPVMGWIAIGLVVLVLLMMIAGIIISRRRSRPEKKKIISKPSKISLNLPSTSAPAALPMNQMESVNLPPVSTRVETTEEGSGYIRPRSEKKKRRVIDLHEEEMGQEGYTSSGVDEEIMRDSSIHEVGTEPVPGETPDEGEIPSEGFPEEAVSGTTLPLEEEDIPLYFDSGGREISTEAPLWDEDVLSESIPEREDVESDELEDIQDWDEMEEFEDLEEYEDVEEFEDVDEWEE